MDPFTMMTIAGGIAEFGQASQQAKIDEARYQQNRINAAEARDLKIQSLNKRAIQESEAASGQKLELVSKLWKQKAHRLLRLVRLVYLVTL